MKPQPTINALDAFYRFIAFGGGHCIPDQRTKYGVSRQAFMAEHLDPITHLEDQRIFIEFDLDGNSMTITAMQFEYDHSTTEMIGPMQIETRQTYELAKPGFLSSMQMDELDRHYDNPDASEDK